MRFSKNFADVGTTIHWALFRFFCFIPPKEGKKAKPSFNTFNTFNTFRSFLDFKNHVFILL